MAFPAVYAISLFGFHTLARSAGPLKPPDLNATDETIVLVRLEELKTVANRLTRSRQTSSSAKAMLANTYPPAWK